MQNSVGKKKKGRMPIIINLHIPVFSKEKYAPVWPRTNKMHINS